VAPIHHCLNYKTHRWVHGARKFWGRGVATPPEKKTKIHVRIDAAQLMGGGGGHPSCPSGVVPLRGTPNQGFNAFEVEFQYVF
jgi:hypothetical protein